MSGLLGFSVLAQEGSQLPPQEVLLYLITFLSSVIFVASRRIGART